MSPSSLKSALCYAMLCYVYMDITLLYTLMLMTVLYDQRQHGPQGRIKVSHWDCFPYRLRQQLIAIWHFKALSTKPNTDSNHNPT